MKQILYTKGKKPAALFIEDGKVKMILEEAKMVKVREDYPFVALNCIKSLCLNKDEPVEEKGITIVDYKKLTENLENKYFGLEYNKKYCSELVIKNKLFYFIYDSDYGAKPSQLFDDIGKLLVDGKRVGWFQGRWKVGHELDFSRAIMSGEPTKIESIYHNLKCPPLLKELIHRIGLPKKFSNLKAYMPIQAIGLLEKEIDALVIGNIICSVKEDELRCLK